jgi:hypothetical protein
MGLSSLEAILGRIPRRFVVVGADAVSDCNTQSCTPKIGPFRIYETEVKGAALYEWNCDGSIIPVLDLGVWPWKEKAKKPIYGDFPLAIAMSLTSHELPVIGTLDLASVPQELAANFTPGATGITLKLPKAGKQFALTFYMGGDYNMHNFNIIQKFATGKDQILGTQGLVAIC